MSFDFEKNILPDKDITGFELITVTLSFSKLMPNYTFEPDKFIQSLKDHQIIEPHCKVDIMRGVNGYFRNVESCNTTDIVLCFEHIDETISFFLTFKKCIQGKSLVIDDPIYAVYTCNMTVLLDFHSRSDYATQTINIESLEFLLTTPLIVKNLQAKKLIYNTAFNSVILDNVKVNDLINSDTISEYRKTLTNYVTVLDNSLVVNNIVKQK